MTILDQRTATFRVVSEEEPPLQIGGLTVRLLCDNAGVCVQELPREIEQGILILLPTVRQYFADKGFEVHVFPEGYDNYLGEYGPVEGRAFRDHIEMYKNLAWLVVHEVGHSLDINLGQPSRQPPWKALCERYYGPEAERVMDDGHIWTTAFHYLNGLGDALWNKVTYCQAVPGICAYMRPRLENPWAYEGVY